MTGDSSVSGQDLLRLLGEKLLTAEVAKESLRSPRESIGRTVGEQPQFRLQKDKMLRRVEDLDSKEREDVVVSMTPRSVISTVDVACSRMSHLQ